MLRDAVIAGTAVNTVSIVVITQVIIATTEAVGSSVTNRNIDVLTATILLSALPVNIPLCELQVGCVVDDGR